MTILHQLGSTLRELLFLVPLPVVRAFFVAVPLIVLLWLLRLPSHAVRESSDSHWSGDLRIWGGLALLVQIAIYSLV